MASRSAVAAADDEAGLRELERQVRCSQRQLADLHRRVDDVERPTVAPRRGAGRSTLNDRDGCDARRSHRCLLQTLDESVDRQQQLLVELQRHRRPLSSALLDDMYQQQKRIAEVSNKCCSRKQKN